MTVPVTRPRAQGYGCRIGDDYFRVAPSPNAPISVYTQDSLAPRSDDAGRAGENVLELGYSFARQNLTGGEGLDWWPRHPSEHSPSSLDEIRFWDSANVDIRRPEAGEAFQNVLSKKLEAWQTPSSTPADMGASRDAVYLIQGQIVERYDDWVDTTPDDTDDLGATLVQLEVGVDDTVVVLDADGDIWVKPDNSEAYVEVYDSATQGGDAQAIWWIKGRIIATRKDAAATGEGDLIEIDPGIGGTPATPTSSSTVSVVDTFTGAITDVVDAGHAIVAACTDGSLRSYVNQVDSAGGVPQLTIRARTNMPRREIPVTLGHNLGTLLIFTLDEAPTGGNKTLRLYTASVLDDRFEFTVGNMQLLRVWQGTDETAPNYTRSVATTRDEAFFAVGEGAGEWNVWRFDYVTLGLFRQLASNRSAADGLVVFDNRIALIDGSAVYLQSTDTYSDSGYLITPNITFGLNTPISWTAFVMEVLNLTAPGARLEFYRSSNPEAILDPDHSTWVLISSLSDPSQSGLEQAAVNIESIQLALQIKWFPSDDGQSSPDMKRFATRGLPQHRDWIAEVPINISDVISAPGRMPVRVPGRGDFVHSTLVSLQGKATTFELYDPPITIRGIVEGLAEPTAYVTHRGSQGRYCVVRFLGKATGTSILSLSLANAGMGIAPAGISTMGIGEL